MCVVWIRGLCGCGGGCACIQCIRVVYVVCGVMYVYVVCGCDWCVCVDVCGVGLQCACVWCVYMKQRCSIMIFTVSMLIALQMKYTCIHTQQVFASGNKSWERSRELFREQKSFFQGELRDGFLEGFQVQRDESD